MQDIDLDQIAVQRRALRSLPSYTWADSCSYLQSRKWRRGAGLSSRGCYRKHQKGKNKEAVRYVLPWPLASLTVWTLRSREKRNSAPGRGLWKTQRHSPSTSNGDQDHGGVLREGGNREPGEYSVDG